MLYQVLILVAKEKLSAIDVSEDGTAETISIEGNEIMTYKSVTDIRNFCRHIKDYYNIDDFSDIEMSVLIVKFDALSSDAVCMLEEVKTANECNLVSIEKLLPVLVLKEGLIKPDMTLQVEIFGSEYSVKMNSGLKVECKEGGDGQDKVKLPIERLSQYFCFNANNLIDNKQELKKCQEELNRKEAACDNLKKELQKEKDKIDVIVTNLYRIREEKRINEEKNKNAKRYICRFEKNFSQPIMNTSGIGIMMKSLDSLVVWSSAEYKIKYLISDGAVVKKNQMIASARAYDSDKKISVSGIGITAVENGRIYRLMSSDATIRDGDAVALIGDLSDTREDIMQWYEKNK